jgi:hypothetical protein
MQINALMGSWVLGAAAVVAVPPANAGEGAASCEPDGATQFICGLGSPEDLIHVPGSNWILVSGMADPATHRSELYAVDAKTHAFKTVYPVADARVNHDRKTYGACPGPLPGETFGAHGIDVQPKGNGLHTVLAVNHAVRESIEVFEMDTEGAQPSLTWVGCVVLPAKAYGNGVVGLPGGGFITTNFKDPADTDAFGKMSAGKITGDVLEWHPAKGWSTLPNSAMSGANGLALSKDGKTLYVAGWPGKNVTRYDRGASGWVRKESYDTGILTDNLRWMADGSILVGGQDANMPAVFECRPPCRIGSAAMKLDPRTGKVTRIAQYAGSAAFEGATTALEVGNEIWLGSFKGSRIARLPAPK